MSWIRHLIRTLWGAVWRNPTDLDGIGGVVLAVYRFGAGLVLGGSLAGLLVIAYALWSVLRR